MLPDRVSNPGPLTYESDALPIALRGPLCLFQLFRCVMATNYKIHERLSFQVIKLKDYRSSSQFTPFPNIYVSVN